MMTIKQSNLIIKQEIKCMHLKVLILDLKKMGCLQLFLQLLINLCCLYSQDLRPLNMEDKVDKKDRLNNKLLTALSCNHQRQTECFRTKTSRCFQNQL